MSINFAEKLHLLICSTLPNGIPLAPKVTACGLPARPFSDDQRRAWRPEHLTGVADEAARFGRELCRDCARQSGLPMEPERQAGFTAWRSAVPGAAPPDMVEAIEKTVAEAIRALPGPLEKPDVEAVHPRAWKEVRDRHRARAALFAGVPETTPLPQSAIEILRDGC